jgi:hypothetical protein
MRVALIAIAVLLLAGCYPTGVEPNAVDDARLKTLSAEPVLAGGRPHPAEANTTSANANAKRAFVSTSQDWTSGGSPETWSLTQDLLADLRAENWVVIVENCMAGSSGLESAQIVALKALDEFTAGLIVKLDTDGATLEAYAPFHEEEPNPWGPLDAQTDGCLDGPDEPTDDTTVTTRTTVGLFYLRES